MDRRVLAGRFRGVATAVLPDDVLRQERAVRSAINTDSTINTDAVLPSLPWQRVDFDLPGPVVTGVAQGGIRSFPQGGVIQRIEAHARVAPTAGPFTFRLVVDGTATDYAGSIQQGSFDVQSGTSITVPHGSIVTVNVTAAGDAEGVTITLFHIVRSTT